MGEQTAQQDFRNPPNIQARRRHSPRTSIYLRTQPGSGKSSKQNTTLGQGKAAHRDAGIISPLFSWILTAAGSVQPTPFAPPGLPLPAPSVPSAAAVLGSRRSSRSRWHGGCGAGPGRALLTHPIGIRRLHRLFIGPHRPQKALGLAFSPSLAPSRSLALAQRRRGSRRNAVSKPASPSATFPSAAKFLPLR